jgi:hypothetical protein
MTTTLARTEDRRTGCPGSTPKSPEQAARYRACGKCGALGRLINAAEIEGVVSPGFSHAAALASG